MAVLLKKQILRNGRADAEKRGEKEEERRGAFPHTDPPHDHGVVFGGA